MYVTVTVNRLWHVQQVVIKAQIIDYNQNYSGEDDGQSMVTLDAAQ